MSRVPATIITSDCLGEALGAAPNLSRSYLGIEVCIISTAQHARPKVIQCKEPVLAQLIKLSLEVVINPFSAKSFAKSLNSSGICFCLFGIQIHFYSHSNAPFFHSYINPIVKTPKKNIIDQKPVGPIPPKDIAQGKRNAISKSKIIKSIATK